MLTIQYKYHPQHKDMLPKQWHIGEPLDIHFDNVRVIRADEDEFVYISELFPHLVPQARRHGVFYGDIARTILMNL